MIPEHIAHGEKAPEKESLNDRKCANGKSDDHRTIVRLLSLIRLKSDDHRPARPALSFQHCGNIDLSG